MKTVFYIVRDGFEPRIYTTDNNRNERDVRRRLFQMGLWETMVTGKHRTLLIFAPLNWTGRKKTFTKKNQNNH